MGMTENKLLNSAREAIESIGIEGVELERERFDPQNFGNGEVVFRLGPLLLRFIRDRGQDFLDVASVTSPDRYHQFDDVEIGMGWKSVEDMVAKSEPEPLADLLRRMRNRLGELQSAMSGNQESFTRNRIERAAEQRGAEFIKRLRLESRTNRTTTPILSTLILLPTICGTPKYPRRAFLQARKAGISGRSDIANKNKRRHRIRGRTLFYQVAAYRGRR